MQHALKAVIWSVLAPAVLSVTISTACAQQAEKVRPAFYVAEFEMKDPSNIKPYRDGVSAIVKKYGGEYLAQGGKAVQVEGSPPNRIVVIKFKSVEAAQRWYDSPEYTALRPYRQRSGITRSYIVEGDPE